MAEELALLAAFRDFETRIIEQYLKPMTARIGGLEEKLEEYSNDRQKDAVERARQQGIDQGRASAQPQGGGASPQFSTGAPWWQQIINSPVGIVLSVGTILVVLFALYQAPHETIAKVPTRQVEQAK